MGKSKLTQEQRREVGSLVNAGVPRKLLAKDYKVSVPTIQKIASQRKEWITGKDKEQRFRYAQKLYPRLSPRLRKRIFDFVYKPVITSIQDRLVGESSERLLLKAVLGPKSLPKIDNKAAAEYRARIRKHALATINDGLNERVIYDNLRHAVLGMGDLVAELEEASLGTGERKVGNSLRKGIDRVLRTLPPRDRRIVELRYGLFNGRVSKLVEVGQLLQLTAERVRQIQDEAIMKLQNPETLGKLEALADSPVLRRCVQHPRYDRRRA